MTDSDATPALFARDLDPNDRREWTEWLAQSRQTVAPATESVLVFRLGGEWLALSTRTVHTVMRRSTLHTVPRPRDRVGLALANVDGTLTVCVSLGDLLRTSAAPHSSALQRAAERVIIVDAPDGRLGFVAQEVDGVHRYRVAELMELPATVQHVATGYTVGLLRWGERSVARLDDTAVLRAMSAALQ